MKIRFTNPFLLAVGSALLAGQALFNHDTLVISFLGGACFGLIWLNLREEKKKN
jgi:hypothetical protein